ncbi:MAG: tetratricopeptide repeat protein [Christensenellales bacterium]
MKRIERAMVYRERARTAATTEEREGLLEKAYALACAAPGIRPPELCLFCLEIASLDMTDGQFRLLWLRRGLEAALSDGGLLPVTPDCLRALFYTEEQPAAARLLWGVAAAVSLRRLEPGRFPQELSLIGRALGEMWQAAGEETRKNAGKLLETDEMAALRALPIWEQGDELAEQALREGLPALTAALTGSWEIFGLTADWPKGRLARLNFLEGAALNRLERFAEAEKRLIKTLAAAEAAGFGDGPLAAEALLELYASYIGRGMHVASLRTLLRLVKHPGFTDLPQVCRLIAYAGLGNESLFLENFEAARKAFTRGVEVLETMEEPSLLYGIQLYQGLYCSLRELDREEETLPVLRELISQLKEVGANTKEIAHTWLCLGIHARHTGRLEEARASVRKALILFGGLPDMEAEESVAWQELMQACLLLRDDAGAEEACRLGLERCDAAGNQVLPLRLRHNLGKTLLLTGREEEAAVAMCRALETWEGGAEETVPLLSDLTDIYFARKDYANALKYARQYLSACHKAYPLRHVQTGVAWNAVGRSQHMLGDKESACRSYTMAIRCLEKLPEEASGLRGDVFFNRAVCCRALQRNEEAAEDLERAIAIQRAAQGDNEKTAAMAHAAGEMLLSAGLVSAAEKYLEDSLRCWNTLPRRNPLRRLEAALLLTTARLRLDDLPGAREAHAVAREAIADLPMEEAVQYAGPMSVNEEAVKLPPPGEGAKILPFKPRKK